MFTSNTEVQVRYAETDQMGIVYHANYLVWMELGRTKLIEDLGFSYARMEEEGILSPVTSLTVDYKKPLKYGEKATIHTWVSEYSGVRVVYGYEMFTPDGELALKAHSSHVCVKKDSFKPINIRKYFPDWDAAYKNAAENRN
ncbi:YbgC/FadM family acyl-CoA thioesterase [Bacillus mangrovi]|uniref:YbgC/FadM family acyl-CoA thioesterase n=1 Tax=Metabacillus mangrovi TaxID=1491830 RepID=A0A7X2S1R2_9BACI|nr:thioesterase family protein [Metabacillus mangrovi]MTH51847.1 YbgC/FadM family acyl-CoA thioesterase [Metabacillus mangrovi]